MTDRTYPPGVPCWVDTEQPDVQAATAFYGGIFGWTYEDAMPPGAPGRYVIAKLDGETRQEVAKAFADCLRSTNGRFKRERFLQACNVGGNQ